LRRRLQSISVTREYFAEASAAAADVAAATAAAQQQQQQLPGAWGIRRVGAFCRTV